jgi:hypothetical protein
MHVALDKLIADLGKAPSKAGATYELTFWCIEAVAATESQVPSELGEIAPMLDKLTALGKRRFKTIDRVAGRARDGAETKLTGRMIHTEHKLVTAPDGIELELMLQVKGSWSDRPSGEGPMVETTLKLPLDQPIVLGDSVGVGASDGAANLLLYVVRARRVD